jgi:hypothetical protein
MEQGHWHSLIVDKKNDGTTEYRVGPVEGMFQARVPVYGKLTFLDRKGQPGETGINVGDVWAYRSYIEGGTLAAAVWTFNGITEAKFPDGLPVEMKLSSFRTAKGNVEKRVRGFLAVRNPKTKEKVDVRLIESSDYATDLQLIPCTLQGANGEKRDLFGDLVHNGKVEIWVTCMEPEQYFGAAQADLYLRAGDASFFFNFVKGYFGIWMQMMLLIGIGVMFSTFLSGPVAMLATIGALLGGFYSTFMVKLATGRTYGGGPLESLWRLGTQDGETIPLPSGLAKTTVLAADQLAGIWLKVLASVLPDFGRFSFADYVTYGFNISGDTILTFGCRMLGFLLPVFIAAYLCLKSREVAK